MLAHRLATGLAAGLIAFLTLERLATGVGTSALAATLLDWAVILAAFALLLGVLNLVGFHARRVARRQGPWSQSLLLLLAALAVAGWGLYPGSEGAAEPAVGWAFAYLISPAEASILALGAVFTVSAAYRALRVRTAAGGLMAASAALVLLLQLPDVQLLWPLAGELRSWLFQVPFAAALRGMLVSVALGSAGLAVSLLLGAWRPYLDA